MLNWNKTQKDNCIVHSTLVDGAEENFIRSAIEKCADKAITLLAANIQDNSLYLLFEWNEDLASLNVVVTDASKTQDSAESVYCVFSGLANTRIHHGHSISHSESVKFWLHDYLTTCTAFFSYSLVAIFHSSTRSNTELL